MGHFFGSSKPQYVGNLIKGKVWNDQLQAFLQVSLSDSCGRRGVRFVRSKPLEDNRGINYRRRESLHRRIS